MLILAIFSRNYVYGNVCEDNFSISDGFKLYWNQTLAGQSSFSTPICLDRNFTKINRECSSNGIWNDSNSKNCSHYTFNKKCDEPNAMEPIRKCLYLRKQEHFLVYECLNVKKLDSNPISAKTKTECMEKTNQKPFKFTFWLPAKRRADFEPFQWTFLGKHYGDIVDFIKLNFTFVDDPHKRCLRLDIVEKMFTLYASECEELFGVYKCETNAPVNQKDKDMAYYSLNVTDIESSMGKRRVMRFLKINVVSLSR